MAIVNAPWRFDHALGEIMPPLLRHLQQGRFGTQSVADACATFSSAMSDTEAALTKAMEDATTDPAKSVEALGTLQTNMESAFSSVSNPKVSALGDKVLSSLGTFAEVATDVIGNGDMTRVADLTKASEEFTGAMQELQTLCS